MTHPFKLDLFVRNVETGDQVCSFIKHKLTARQLQQITDILENNNLYVGHPLVIDWQGVPPHLNYAMADNTGFVFAFNITDTGHIENGTMFRVPNHFVIINLCIDQMKIIRRPAGA